LRKYSIGFCTVPNADIASKIARKLVEEQLVACVNIIPGLVSIYRWQGKIEESSELLCVMKTWKKLIPKVMDTIKNLHSYEVPEIIFSSIETGWPPYLQWIFDSTQR
jgi:periplasmic divalent cation tolerance protein